MEIPPAVLDVHRRLKDAGHQAFLVGGCVRDMVLGKTPKDFDLASSALPEQVQQVFKKVIPTGIQHGTVTVVVNGVHVEVTTFRSEGAYVDGRRPESVEFHSDIAADLARRDFTINAMAFDPVTKEIVDPFDGQRDLTAKLVRCVRDPLERFGEDGLRCLRAVRFATILGFDIDPATEAAVKPTLPVFKKVAGERVRDELLKIIASDHVERGLGLLQRTGLLAAIFPELGAPDFAAIARAPAVIELRLALLLRGSKVPVARLKLSSQQNDRVSALIKERPPEKDDGVTLRRWLAKVGVSLARDLVALDAPALGEKLENQIAKNPPLTTKDLALDGAALMKVLAVGPGRVIGEASRWLLEQVLERPELNTPQELQALLAKWPR